MAEIKCTWCGSTYTAYNENRRHCTRSSCRDSEIEINLEYLAQLFGMILRHGIEADVEIRLPGNDTLGKQAKIISSGDIHEKISSQEMINKGFEGQIDDLKEYFRSLLWKKIKGNFEIKTKKGGVIDTRCPHEMFTSIERPMILGRNKIILTKEKEVRNVNNQGCSGSST